LVELQHAATGRHFIAGVTEELDWLRSSEFGTDTRAETPVDERPN
jgi:hypothetical protein